MTQPGNWVTYSIQAPGPHGSGYRLAGSPISCCQLEADAGTISHADKGKDTHSLRSLFTLPVEQSIDHGEYCQSSYCSITVYCSWHLCAQWGVKSHAERRYKKRQLHAANDLTNFTCDRQTSKKINRQTGHHQRVNHLQAYSQERGINGHFYAERSSTNTFDIICLWNKINKLRRLTVYSSFDHKVTSSITIILKIAISPGQPLGTSIFKPRKRS